MAQHEWNAVDLERQLGKASWVWDDDMGMHLPTCSRLKLNRGGVVIRCGNGPLVGNEIDEGTCSEGPHMERHERSI
jgi:hypothetical protein